MALMTVRRPRAGEPDVGSAEVEDALTRAGVVHGIRREAIEVAVRDRICETPVKVAAGDPPQNGTNAQFEYCFDIDFHRSPQVDKEGRIDYRDLNVIQSVAKGDVLARRIPATPGIAGKGVDGRDIPALQGKSLPFRNGANTQVSGDGRELRATGSGVIVYRNGMIWVDDVVVIDGDVDFRTGNIRSTNSVLVKGNIHPGFELAVDGDLQVGGNVQDCRITCRGNVLIKGGGYGKGEGSIRAEGSVVLKYAEGQRISAGEEVVVGGELLNCRVVAGKRVLVKGKKGKIIGGEVMAGHEVRGSVIGSPAGTPTKISVGYDAEVTRQHREVVREIERLRADCERVKQSLSELYRQQAAGPLASDKQAALLKLEEFRETAPHAIAALEEKKAPLEEKLKEFRDAVIIAEDTMHVGVEARFGVVYRQVTETTTQCKLALKGNQIVFSEYRPRDLASFV